MNELSRLAEKISEITGSTPTELVDIVLPGLFDWDKSNWASSRMKALVNIHNPQVRTDFQTLFDLWQQDCPELPSSAIALAMESSLRTHIVHKAEQIDLVWTGPATRTIPVRRTDQALLQLISTAKKDLLIVSFAVYKVRAISEALEQAIRRSIRLRIILESPEESGGKISFPGSKAFSEEVLRGAEFYSWPLDRREVSKDGKYGSLHAKVALADEDTLFISSANLTEYALDLNMELGVLVHGGSLPTRVFQHFQQLLTDNYLKRLIK